jgi:hypothetical protein
MSRVASIRRQIDLISEIIERVVHEPEDDFRCWMDALSPLTDDLIRELHEAESTTAGRTPNPWFRLHGDKGVAWEDWL